MQRRWLFVWLTAFLCCAVMSSLFAFSTVIAVYKTVALGVYGVFAVVLGWYLQTEKNFSSWLTLWIVPFVCIAVMALYEVITGQSMGLWIVGNWDFSVLTPGIARVQLLGHTILRPYTVFPHPNVLGGISTVFAVLFIFWLNSNKEKSWLKTLSILSTWLLVLVSFSRSAWIAGIIGLVIFLVIKRRHVYVSRPILFFGGISLLVIIPYISQISIHEPAVSERIELMERSIDMIKSKPLFGGGNGNFTLILKEFRTAEKQLLLQPVHVVWLLIASELGVITAIIFILGLAWLLRDIVTLRDEKAKLTLGIIWVIISIISLADHYWWSLPIGSAVFWLMLGISLSMIQSKQHI